MSGIAIPGLWYVVGKTVSVWLAGLDCGDYVVNANGTIIIPYQSDPDGLLTATYLKAVSDRPDGVASSTEFPARLTVTIGGTPTLVTVPMVVGFTYVSEAQIVRPNTQAELKTQQGPGLGETRRTHMYAIQTVESVGLWVGGDVGHVYKCQFSDSAGNTLNSATAFTGIHQETLDDDYSFDGMIFWEVFRPYPVTVVGLTGFTETSER